MTHWLDVLRGGRGRPLGLIVLLALTALLADPAPRPVRTLRLAAFDAYQRLNPRVPGSEPVVIVAVDEASLARHGQWPWPRTTLARLVDGLAGAQPAAIGLDILMPEPDRLSLHQLPSLVPEIGPEIAAMLARLPSNDAQLARALRGRPVVLGMAGLDTPAAGPARSLRRPPFREFGADPRPFLRRFESALGSLEELEAAAAGHGLLSADVDGGIVRRFPLIALAGGALAPGFAVEVLRVATGQPAIAVRTGGQGVESVAIGPLTIPSAPDASVRPHYSHHRPERFVSAQDVLAGQVNRERLAGRIVLVGVTAFGLADYQATPVLDRMAGIELHAQLIESILEGALLSRPRWLGWLEMALLAGSGLALVALVPRLSARRSVALAALLAAVPPALGVMLFGAGRLLLDGITPALALGGLYTAMLAVTLANTDAHRRALGRLVAAQREAAARVAGEMEAARRIQMGMLPAPADALGGDPRASVHATLEPALLVGGDFYEVLRLDADHVFFMVGDVSGKGLPGSLFMAVSKTLYKSAALRRRGEIAAMMREANAEVSRDNPEALFVTVFAGILDLRTGEVEYCNAGHELPHVLSPGALPVRLPLDPGGPPLCVIEDFPYTAGRLGLRPGEILCMVTDGVTEARAPSGDLYGRARLEGVLASVSAGGGADRVGRAVRDSVAAFTGGAAASDDLTILVVEWHGPAGRG